MSLELGRKKLELKRVIMAKEELEFAILEREADILRIKSNIENQEKKISEIQKELKNMEVTNG